MADRVLVWCYEGALRCDGNRSGPTYYIDDEYVAVAVRIQAVDAPTLDDAEFDIKIDGVSIFANRTFTPVSRSGQEALVMLTTTAILPKGDNYELDAEDFKAGSDTLDVEEDSWVYCVPVKSGGGRNFTISLEQDKSLHSDRL